MALQRWTSNDLPSSPAAWLLSTARHRAIDHLRRNQRLNQLAPELAYLAEIGYDNCSTDPGMNEEVAVPDKHLELMFTCCHLSLAWKTRVALTLKTVAGLDTEQLARAFLDKTSTMAQRLTRAKQKISASGIAYEVPDLERLPERLDGVLAVVYFIFNEGYAASTGEQLTRGHLCD